MLNEEQNLKPEFKAYDDVTMSDDEIRTKIAKDNEIKRAFTSLEDDQIFRNRLFIFDKENLLEDMSDDYGDYDDNNLLNKLIRYYIIAKARRDAGDFAVDWLKYQEPIKTRFEYLLLKKIKALPDLDVYINGPKSNVEFFWKKNMEMIESNLADLKFEVNSEETKQEFLTHDFIKDVFPILVLPDVHHDFNLTDEDRQSLYSSIENNRSEDPGMGSR